MQTPQSALFAANNVDTVTRGHSLKLFVQQSRIDARKYFFSNRGIVCRPQQTTFYLQRALEDSYNELI